MTTSKDRNLMYSDYRLILTYADIFAGFIERASSPNDKADKVVRARHGKAQTGGSSERVVDH